MVLLDREVPQRRADQHVLADTILELEQPAASCDDLRARLANIAELRDEMRTAGGAVVWIDDLDEILDGPHPGVALTPEDAVLAAQALRYTERATDDHPAWPTYRLRALAEHLEAGQ